MTLGERIVRLRNQKGLSQDALAELLGISRQSVSKWETDASVPELDKLIRLSDVFGISLDALVRGEEKEQETEEAENPGTGGGGRLLRQKAVGWYQERAYLLGWLSVAWGVYGFLRAVWAVTAIYLPFGGIAGALKLFALMSNVHIANLLKILLGAMILLWGRRGAGGFRWYHLGWGPVIVGLFGIPGLRTVSTGLLSLLLMFLFLPSRKTLLDAEAASALLAETRGCLVLCVLGLLMLTAGRWRTEKKNPRS